MWPNPQKTEDLVTFTEEIANGKLHFLCIFTNVWQYLTGITAIRGNSFGLNFLVTIDWFLFVLLTFYRELGTGCYLIKII